MIEITDEGAKRAADLANAEADRLGHKTTWRADDFSGTGLSALCLALARLATQSIADKAHTEAIEAQLAEAKADLAEICGIVNALPPQQASLEVALWLGELRELAAKHRVETDPLYEALFAVVELGRYDTREQTQLLRAELAKRGIPIPGGKS